MERIVRALVIVSILWMGGGDAFATVALAIQQESVCCAEPCSEEQNERCPESHQDGHCPPRCGFCVPVPLAVSPAEAGAVLLPPPPLALDALVEAADSPSNAPRDRIYRPPRV